MVKKNYSSGNNKSNAYKDNNYSIKKIDIPLSKKYSDIKSIYLEDGIAYNYAKKMTKIAPSQLRKVLDQIKSSSSMIKQNPEKFEDARNNLYFLVPITAYNTGRNEQINFLYEFVYQHINEKSLASSDDIFILDQLFTSIIAYHKYLKEMGEK